MLWRVVVEIETDEGDNDSDSRGVKEPSPLGFGQISLTSNGRLKTYDFSILNSKPPCNRSDDDTNVDALHTVSISSMALPVLFHGHVLHQQVRLLNDAICWEAARGALFTC